MFLYLSIPFLSCHFLFPTHAYAHISETLASSLFLFRLFTCFLLFSSHSDADGGGEEEGDEEVEKKDDSQPILVGVRFFSHCFELPFENGCFLLSCHARDLFTSRRDVYACIEWQMNFKGRGHALKWKSCRTWRLFALPFAIKRNYFNPLWFLK